jgi:hypothetical protein
MGYASRSPAGVGNAGETASRNPNPATVGQILDIKRNFDMGNLNGNNTVTPPNKVILRRKQTQKEKE